MRDLNAKAPIVVGVDESAAADRALDWAVAEATATRRPLRIVHVLAAPWSPSPSDQPLARAASRARTAAPDLEVIRKAVVGPAVPTLLGEADAAELLVLGAAAGRLTGSVSLAVAARAACPVVVVHGRDGDDAAATPAARVVVGSDGSELAAAATRFAFQAASRRGAGLTVVRAWTPPFAGYPRLVLGLPRLARAERHRLLTSLTADRLEFPEVDVELKLVRDKHNHHGRALIEESASATLVVLGSHGHGGFTGLMSDAVSESVLARAHCPVAVVKLRPVTAPPSRRHAVGAGSPGNSPLTRPQHGSSTGEVADVLRWLHSNE